MCFSSKTKIVQEFEAYVAEEIDQEKPGTQSSHQGSDSGVQSCLRSEPSSRDEKSVCWQRKRTMLHNEEAHYDCSNYQWYYCHEIETRQGGEKARYKPAVIKRNEDKAERAAQGLQKECNTSLGQQGQACLSSDSAGRSFIVDSGASFHLIGRNYSKSEERKGIRKACARRVTRLPQPM